jgi:Flp pilus assembly protein TadD
MGIATGGAIEGRLGNMLMKMDRWSEAIPHLEIAVQRKPQDSELVFALGAALVRNQHVFESLPYLRRAVQLDPTNEQAATYLRIVTKNLCDFQAQSEILECHEGQ